MQETPNANRLHIAIFGRRNAGKSSLINAITNQETALVSELAGTTTDPVYKAMELLPVGPVVFIDTAGLDDVGEIGKLRIQKTRAVMDKTDIALLVLQAEAGLDDYSLELEWLKELNKRKIPVIGVLNKVDLGEMDEKKLEADLGIPFVKVSASQKKHIGRLKEAIAFYAPEEFERKTIVGDIVGEKELVILVAPQDLQAPKGRLILPQVQIIRDLLDHSCMVLTVKDSELVDLLSVLNRKPKLVITDSQVFQKVNSILDRDIPLTSFSILMARYKGDLETFVHGARAIEALEPGDKVLIAEACTHHALQGDIGREKLPKWLEDKVGGMLSIEVRAGADFPDDLTQYKLVIHCGSCMLNRKQLLSRVIRSKEQTVPITNYGTAIAQINGILDRVVEVFE